LRPPPVPAILAILRAIVWVIPKDLQHSYNVILSAAKDLADQGDSSLRSE